VGNFSLMSDWATMNARPRALVAALTQADIPAAPGVYAFYRDGMPLYVGKAASLRARLWTNHLRRGASMTNSAFRRNVAAEIGIASAADRPAVTRRRRPTPTRSAPGLRLASWPGSSVRASSTPWYSRLRSRPKQNHV
jgi:hypothetical protein